MPSMLDKALDVGLEFNDRAAAAAANGFDWLFRRDRLIKSGQTPYTVVHTGDPMSVRHYDLAGVARIELADGGSMPVRRRRYHVPLVLLPPLGVTTETFDLMPNRSLVRYMTAAGFKVYLIDWGRPSRRHARLGVKDYADRMIGEALHAVRAHAGVEEVTLMGWCMGGLFALLHAGIRHDPRIRAIVTVASPIDLRSGGMIAGVAQAINTPARLIRRYTDFRLHSIDPERMHAPSWVTTIAFKLTNPIGSVTTYWDLLMRLWDREFVESHSTTSDYLNNMLVYPAGMVQDFVVHAAVDNKLAAGTFKLGKRTSRLSNIHAPLLAFAGETDSLVKAATASRIMDLVSSTDRQFEVAPGGHMGVILGSRAQSFVWADSARWLARRSAARPPAPMAGRAANRAGARQHRVAEPPATKKRSRFKA